MLISRKPKYIRVHALARVSLQFPYRIDEQGKPANIVLKKGQSVDLDEDDISELSGLPAPNQVRVEQVGYAYPASLLGYTTLSGEVISVQDAIQAIVGPTRDEVTTVGPGPDVAQTFPIPLNSVMLVESRVVGVRTSGSGSPGDSATFVRTARFKNVAGVVSSYTPQTDFTSKDQPTWDARFSIAGLNAELIVSGPTGATIDWQVTTSVQVLAF